MSDSQRPERDPELVLPLTVFQDVVRYPDLVMVLSYESSEGWFADYNKIVKIVGIDDQLFGQYTEGDRSAQFTGHVFYDICQIRECRVRDVKVIEWMKNLGPQTPRDWMQYKRKGPNSPVRVYHMNKVTYNLRAFNKEFGWGMR